MALNIGPGDEVITTPYTWISTAEVITLLGAEPVFVDIEATSWNMDPRRFEEAITERTKAVIPVGIYGQPAKMNEISTIAQQHNISVIEDAAQCYGSTHYGKRSGGLSTIGTTSFFPSKPLGCYGDGGALFTNSDDLAEKMRQIRIHGQERKHYHPRIGINGRFDTIQAAVLLEKIALFDDEINKRNQIASLYEKLFEPHKNIATPKIAPGNTSVWAQYTIQCDDPQSLHEKLKGKQIPSVRYYVVPLHLQPVFHRYGYLKGDFPIAERIASHGLSIPMNPYLTAKEVKTVVSCC